MPLTQISDEIARFLSNNDPEILCLKGRWGVGKTYAWRQFLKAAQKESRISYKKYSYVSLFGRNSLAELRNSIVENTVGTENVEAKPSVASLEQAHSLARQAVQKTGFFAGLLPQSSGYAQIWQRTLFLLMKNTIVCLDDLERAGAGLSIKDIFGLASQLKDEKNCKVVILLNDEKLEKASRDAFAEHLEKVVDVVIDFEVLPEEAASIALNNKTDFYNDIREKCIKLKIKNIRVIKKAERFCSSIMPLLSEFDNRLRHQAVHTATLACYAKYQPGIAPSIESIRSFNLWDAAIRTVNGDKTEVDPAYTAIQDYGFTSVDGFDEVILEAVDRGFVDKEKFNTEAAQIAANLYSSDMKEDYQRTWEIYRSSFARNEEYLSDTMVRAVEANILIIDHYNLDSVVSVLREIGYEKKAVDLIDFYMTNKNEDNLRYWDLREFEYLGRIKNPDIISAIAERHRSIKGVVDPIEHLKKIDQHDGWNDKDELAILQLSEDDIFELLIASKGEDFIQILSTYRRFLSIGNPSPNVTEICRRAKIALGKVSGLSKLNARRVKSHFYDVNINA